ncbi:MAG: hypothetical protein ACYTFG_16415 [Planctomycetota bacterium]
MTAIEYQKKRFKFIVVEIVGLLVFSLFFLAKLVKVGGNADAAQTYEILRVACAVVGLAMVIGGTYFASSLKKKYKSGG